MRLNRSLAFSEVFLSTSSKELLGISWAKTSAVYLMYGGLLGFPLTGGGAKKGEVSMKWEVERSNPKLSER